MQLNTGDRLEMKKPHPCGGNVVVNPGVTIGEGSVIGSGSVVTKDIPANVIAAGNPCRVIREITEADKTYWETKRDQYLIKKGASV